MRPENETYCPTISKLLELYVVTINDTGDIDRGLRTLLTVNVKVSPASLPEGNIFSTTRVSPVGVMIELHKMLSMPEPTAQVALLK